MFQEILKEGEKERKQKSDIYNHNPSIRESGAEISEVQGQPELILETLPHREQVGLSFLLTLPSVLWDYKGLRDVCPASTRVLAFQILVYQEVCLLCYHPRPKWILLPFFVCLFSGDNSLLCSSG